MTNPTETTVPEAYKLQYSGTGTWSITGPGLDEVVGSEAEMRLVYNALAQLPALKAELAKAEGISQGRLNVLEEKAAQLITEWKRAENAEAQLAAHQAALADATVALEKICCKQDITCTDAFNEPPQTLLSIMMSAGALQNAYAALAKLRALAPGSP